MHEYSKIMSISFLGLETTGIKNALKWHIKEHASEIVIVGIMIGLSVSVAMLATGDITEAIDYGFLKSHLCWEIAHFPLVISLAISDYE